MKNECSLEYALCSKVTVDRVFNGSPIFMFFRHSFMNQIQMFEGSKKQTKTKSLKKKVKIMNVFIKIKVDNNFCIFLILYSISFWIGYSYKVYSNKKSMYLKEVVIH